MPTSQKTARTNTLAPVPTPDTPDSDGAVQIQFWGVRGSIPSPGPDTVYYGGNTSCVTVEAPGHNLFIFDAGSGIRTFGQMLVKERRLPITAHLFLSHTHWDHIQGFPFFAPAFAPGNRLVIHGGAGTDSDLSEALEGQMLHQYFPVRLTELGAELRFQHVALGRNFIDGVALTAALLHHPGMAVGYRLDIGGVSLAYVTDTEPPGELADLSPDPAVLELAQDVDVLIHDAQYTDEEYPAKAGWGHSPIGYVMNLAAQARAKRLLLFHHDPARTDAQLNQILEVSRQKARSLYPALQIDAAREGMRVALTPAQPGHARQRELATT